MKQLREQYPNDEEFESRLAAADIDPSKLRRGAEAVRLDKSAQIPEWVRTVETVITRLTTRSWTVSYDDLPAESPFHVFFDALATVVCELANVDGLLPSRAAVEDVRTWLRTRLQRRFARILYVEFNYRYTTRDSDQQRSEQRESPVHTHRAFTEALLDGEVADVVSQYPMFGRLVVKQIDQIHNHFREFTQRVNEDASALADLLDADELGPVTGIEPLADDTHGNGRMVTAVTFDSGDSVVYKPRSVDAGVEFYRLFEWFDQQIPGESLSTPDFLPRDTYGWMERVSPSPVESEREATAYYEKAGRTLCLCYFLNVTDLHIENVIAAGTDSLIVDVETVMHATPTTTLRTTAGPLREATVLNTGLLPYVVDDLHDTASDDELTATSAGFAVSSDPARPQKIKHPVLKQTNTDDVFVAQRSPTFSRNDNIPTIDGVDAPPSEYVGSVLDGFRLAYDAVSASAENDDLPERIRSFASITNRFVPRPTTEYTNTIFELQSVDALSCGVSFDATIEKLAAPMFLRGGEGVVPLLTAERTALHRLDPPRFTTTCGTQEAYHDRDEIDIPIQPGMRRVVSRIETADDDDCRQQCNLIERSLAPERQTVTEHSSADNRPGDAPLPDSQQLSHSIVRDEIEDVFGKVTSIGHRGPDGSIQWSSIPADSTATRLPIRPSGWSIAYGKAGHALFGAAVATTTDNQEARQFVEDVLRPLRTAKLTDTSPVVTDHHGAMAGVGSLLYALGVIDNTLPSVTLLPTVEWVLDTVSPEFVARDERFDLMDGGAGTLLALLKLHDVYGITEAREYAVDCGEHLLENRVEADTGHRVWQTLDNAPPMTGFAHGAGGIGYALARLWDETGSESFREAAVEAVEYEATTYDQETDEWADLRPWVDDPIDGWCHGRTGIGLGRIGMSRLLDHETIDADLSRTSPATATDLFGHADYFCCGNAGRIEFLSEFCREFDRNEELSDQLASWMLTRRRTDGRYRLQTSEPLPDSTFSYGLAGVGYSLCRLVNSELPSVALFE